MRHIIALVTALLMTSGCATMRDSMILGAGSGFAAGAVTGAMASSESKGTGAMIGGAIGAGVGLVAAYFTHKSLEDRDSKIRKDTLFSLEKFGVSDVPNQSSAVPAISFRVIEEQKVETNRQGNKVIEGHRIWILSDDSNVQYNPPPTKDKERK